jgi:hypothetical protein
MTVKIMFGMKPQKHGMQLKCNSVLTSIKGTTEDGIS